MNITAGIAAYGLSIWALLSGVAGTDTPTVDPISVYAQNLHDELVRVYKMDVAEARYQEIRLFRISLDFNNDGLTDLAIGDTFHSGNASLGWELYSAKPDGHYRHLGGYPLSFSPEHFCIQPAAPGRSRLICYHHMSWDTGYIVELKISPSGIERGESRLINIVKNEADRETYKHFFGDQQDRVERFLTSCYLDDYLRDRNTLWRRGYGPVNQVPSILVPGS